ncbi:unnamed protein product [Meganyctiphanes norvegica]|uniref:Uncharacterized protein n=1 Tax=Meganyctiphanes norvegica TaxID=48144 RepID=A0AAV2SA18_MEGNR
MSKTHVRSASMVGGEDSSDLGHDHRLQFPAEWHRPTSKVLQWLKDCFIPSKGNYTRSNLDTQAMYGARPTFGYIKRKALFPAEQNHHHTELIELLRTIEIMARRKSEKATKETISHKKGK